MGLLCTRLVRAQRSGTVWKPGAALEFLFWLHFLGPFSGEFQAQESQDFLLTSDYSKTCQGLVRGQALELPPSHLGYVCLGRTRPPGSQCSWDRKPCLC